MLPVILLGIVAFFTKGTFPLVAIFTVLIYSLLEEIGWRGILQQLLAPLPKFVAILCITVLWFVWHLDFTPTSTTLLFVSILLLGSWGIGLVAEKTNSLLVAAAFHALNNIFTGFDLQKVILLAALIIIWVLSIKYRHQLEKISFRKETNSIP
ncbi:MAG: CPBP family intramembrane metalloprotease [Bacteroidia bacterium]|nr:CPBP family intramembrane metalloprotease [Bacteroidia bacterium]